MIKLSSSLHQAFLLFKISLVHSHWSRNVKAWLSLVESFIVLLRQLSYAIKNQLGHPKPPTRVFACPTLVLYGIRAPLIDPFRAFGRRTRKRVDHTVTITPQITQQGLYKFFSLGGGNCLEHLQHQVLIITLLRSLRLRPLSTQFPGLLP